VYRLVLVAVAVMLAGCSTPPRPKQAIVVDPTAEAWYSEAVTQLSRTSRQAREWFAMGEFDKAGEAVTGAQSLQARVLGVPRPTLAAMLAASDLDDLYGRMLLRNHRYGWARTVFQKNVARWKNWRPRTAATEQRLKAALAAVAECDRRLAE
jgi:hypothetical protein